ncbi:unnamed protein product, partial [Phaeothamnion confervicola]
MQRHYEARLAEADDEIRRMEGDRAALAAALARSEERQHEGVAAAEEAARLRKRLLEQDEHLLAARGKHRELTSLAQGSSRRDGEVRQLEAEITRMKRARVDLSKELDAHKKHQQEVLQQKAREIQALHRSAARDQAALRKLDAAKTKAEAVARRHLEELALLRRLQRQKLGVGRRAAALTAEEKRHKAELEARVAALAQRQEAAERLAAEYEKKLVLLQQKESLELVRTSLMARRIGLGISAASGTSPRAAASAAAAVVKGHGAMARSAEAATGSAVAVSAAAVGAGPPMGPRELLELGAGVEGRLSQEEEETLQEVEDRLESTLAQLHFKDEKIRSMEAEAR